MNEPLKTFRDSRRDEEVIATRDLVAPSRAAGDETEPPVSEANRSLTTNGHVETSNAQPAAVNDQQAEPEPLFAENELQSFRSRWSEVQTSFVDEPREAVKQADNLVASVVKHITEQFAAAREQLDKQWDGGDSVDTEDLRQALKRYRALFDRLLAV